MLAVAKLSIAICLASSLDACLNQLNLRDLIKSETPNWLILQEKGLWLNACIQVAIFIAGRVVPRRSISMTSTWCCHHHQKIPIMATAVQPRNHPDAERSVLGSSAERENLSPKQVRQEFRRSTQRITSTSGLCSGYLQMNVACLPSTYADEFEVFCRKNAAPLPFVCRSKPGQVTAAELAEDLDIRLARRCWTLEYIFMICSAFSYVHPRCDSRLDLTCHVICNTLSRPLKHWPNYRTSLYQLIQHCCIQHYWTVCRTRSSNNFCLIKCCMKFDFHQTYCPTNMFEVIDTICLSNRYNMSGRSVSDLPNWETI